MFVWSRQEEDEALVSGLIASQFPDTGIDAARVRFLSEGEDYKVFECEGWAWRFPKRSEVESWLLREGPLLEAIGPTLDVPVPRFSLHGSPGNGFPFAFVGYRMLPGTAADHLDDAASPELANSLARFLSALHRFPVNMAERMGMPDCRCLFEPERYQTRVREAYASASTALPASLRAACDAFFADPQPPGAPASEWTRLIHGDLEAEHILLEPFSRRIAGVLDWSDACLGDPARDFGALWAWGGDRFLEALLAAYTCGYDRDFVPRLKFLGRCYSLSHYVASLTEGESQIAFSLRQLDNVFRD